MAETPPKIRPIDADDEPKQETPPKANIPTPDDVPRSKRRGDDRKLLESLSRFYATVGGGVATAGMFRNDVGLVASGTNIATKSIETAELWMELADTNPKIKRFLESFMEGSAIANLVAAHMAMVVPLIASQGLIPGEIGGLFLSDEAKAAAMAFQAQAAAAAAANNGEAPSGG